MSERATSLIEIGDGKINIDQELDDGTPRPLKTIQLTEEFIETDPRGEELWKLLYFLFYDNLILFPEAPYEYVESRMHEIFIKVLERLITADKRLFLDFADHVGLATVELLEDWIVAYGVDREPDKAPEPDETPQPDKTPKPDKTPEPDETSQPPKSWVDQYSHEIDLQKLAQRRRKI